MSWNWVSCAGLLTPSQGAPGAPHMKSLHVMTKVLGIILWLSLCKKSHFRPSNFKDPSTMSFFTNSCEVCTHLIFLNKSILFILLSLCCFVVLCALSFFMPCLCLWYYFPPNQTIKPLGKEVGSTQTFFLFHLLWLLGSLWIKILVLYLCT